MMDPGTAFIDMWNRNIEDAQLPNVIYIPTRTYIYLRRPYMTKRGFRRWRAKLLRKIRLRGN